MLLIWGACRKHQGSNTYAISTNNPRQQEKGSSRRIGAESSRLGIDRQHITDMNPWSGDLASMPYVLLLATR